MIMKNNLRVQNPLIYHAEGPLTIYRDVSTLTTGQAHKFGREENHMEDSRGNKKADLKVEIHDLLKKHFTKGICKVNPSLRFRYLESFYNVHTSALSKDNKACKLGIFQQNTHLGQVYIGQNRLTLRS